MIAVSTALTFFTALDQAIFTCACCLPFAKNSALAFACRLCFVAKQLLCLPNLTSFAKQQQNNTANAKSALLILKRTEVVWCGVVSLELEFQSTTQHTHLFCLLACLFVCAKETCFVSELREHKSSQKTPPGDKNANTDDTINHSVKLSVSHSIKMRD
jgi:hypothetical protein